MLVACRHPEEVVVDGGEEVAATPDKDEDFFSSWDKPAIKRPTPPPSRTGTPPVIVRTASPLNPQAGGNGAAGNGIARSKSPLTGTATPAAPAAPRTTTSSALRTKSGASGPRKSGVLGAKKGKLGAKKLVGETIDFDEAEKRAKEEADRIAKLGYDPDGEEEKDKGKFVASTLTRAGAKGDQRNSSDVEKMGLQMNRLGFGQVGGGAAAKAAPKKMGGFGSVGTSASQGTFIAC